MKFSLIKIQSSLAAQDIKDFLQKLVTNNLQTYTYTFLLSPKGRYIADFFVIELKNEIFLEVPENLKNKLIEKLDLYKIGLEIEFVETPYIVLYSKNQSIEDLNDDDFLYIERDPRNVNLKYRICLERGLVSEKIYKKLLEDYLEDKYLYKIVDFLDFNERSFIAKYNLDSGISFDKGCYIGQEVMMRAKRSDLDSKYEIKLFKIKEYIKSQKFDLISINNCLSEKPSEIDYDYEFSDKNFTKNLDRKIIEPIKNNISNFLEESLEDKSPEIIAEKIAAELIANPEQSLMEDLIENTGENLIEEVIKSADKSKTTSHTHRSEDIKISCETLKIVSINMEGILHPDVISIQKEEEFGIVTSMYIKNHRATGLCLVRVQNIENQLLTKIGEQILMIQFI